MLSDFNVAKCGNEKGAHTKFMQDDRNRQKIVANN